MALIGYARVSTEDQQTDPQLDELRAARCREICEALMPSTVDHANDDVRLT